MREREGGREREREREREGGEKEKREGKGRDKKETRRREIKSEIVNFCSISECFRPDKFKRARLRMS